MKSIAILVLISVSVLQIRSLSSDTGCPYPEIPKDPVTVPVEVPFPVIFPNVDSMLKILQLPQFDTNGDIQDLLRIYRKAEKKKNEYENSGRKKKYPLIVLEGLSASGKTTLANVLTGKINSTRIHSPPDSVAFLKTKFQYSNLLYLLYYRFANYISALEAYVLLDQSPIVLDRYWYSTTTYALGCAVYYTRGEYVLPPKGNKIYNWPDDLLKPDIVLYLNIDENIREQRLHQRLEGNFTTLTTDAEQIKRKFGRDELLLQKCTDFRETMFEAYKHMDNPGVTMLDATFHSKDVLEDAYSKIKPLLNSVNDS